MTEQLKAAMGTEYTAAPQPASEPQPTNLPDFAASVAQRKWGELKADGWRMTRIEFEHPESTSVGSINPWGVVTWKHQEREPQPAPVGVDASDAPPGFVARLPGKPSINHDGVICRQCAFEKLECPKFTGRGDGALADRCNGEYRADRQEVIFVRAEGGEA